jgi:iron complex transport system ATP-binding protein
LSGGEQQRVFIARAICQKPKIILLDEPTAALDLAHQIHIMDLLEQLKQKQNMTVIMVSHDLNLAGMYAERLLLLKQGKIVKLGTPYQVLTQNTLESVYGCRLVTDKSRLGDFPLITPIPERFFSR